MMPSSRLTRPHCADTIWNESGLLKMSDRNPKPQGPLEDAAVAHAAADVVRKAHAVGLTDESPDFAGLTYPVVKRTVLRVREAGIGERAAGYVAAATGTDRTTLAERLREISALLDESPLPATEWRRVLGGVDRRPLASPLRPCDRLPPRGPAPPLLLGRPPAASGAMAWAGRGSCAVHVRHAGWRVGRVSQARRDSHAGGSRHDSSRAVGDRNRRWGVGR